MRKCPKCHFSLLALKVAQGVGSDHKTGVCDRCAIPESDDHVLIGETFEINGIIIELDISGHGENNR